jgi:hypothetical protein
MSCRGARHTNLHYDHDQSTSLRANSVSRTNTSEADGRELQARHRGKLPEMKCQLKVIYLKKILHPTRICVNKTARLLFRQAQVCRVWRVELLFFRAQGLTSGSWNTDLRHTRTSYSLCANKLRQRYVRLDIFRRNSDIRSVELRVNRKV